MNNSAHNASRRLAELQNWLVDQFAGFDPALNQLTCVPISSGARLANFKHNRHFRITISGDTYIVMDGSHQALATPERDAAFITVAKLLTDAGLNSPKVVAHDPTEGFWLLSPIGQHSYQDSLNEENADGLFRLAADALIRWQLTSRPDVLPHLDAAQLKHDLSGFEKCYLTEHLGLKLGSAQQLILANVFMHIAAVNCSQGKVFVHRDFAPQNLMISAASPGILGFEGAVFGPVSYDIASLYKDAFRSWDEERVLDGTIRYWEKAKKSGLPVPDDFGDFYRHVEWAGLQRHLHLLGVFANQSTHCLDDGPDYLADAPRFLNYIRKVGERYTALFPLIRLLDALKIDDGVVRKSAYTF